MKNSTNLPIDHAESELFRVYLPHIRERVERRSEMAPRITGLAGAAADDGAFGDLMPGLPADQQRDLAITEPQRVKEMPHDLPWRVTTRFHVVFSHLLVACIIGYWRSPLYRSRSRRRDARYAATAPSSTPRSVGDTCC